MNHALPAIAVLLPILTLAVGLITGVGIVPAVVSGCASVVLYLRDWWRGCPLSPAATPARLAWLVDTNFGLLFATWVYCLLWAAGVAL